jgi:hypothetical protein
MAPLRASSRASMMLRDFPPHVQRKVQRILDEESRRLLEEELEREVQRSADLPESGHEAAGAVEPSQGDAGAPD